VQLLVVVGLGLRGWLCSSSKKQGVYLRRGVAQEMPDGGVRNTLPSPLKSWSCTPRLTFQT
jgi:hypothetical protein